MTAVNTGLALPMPRLLEYVRAATVIYRKGEVIKEATYAGLKVITIDAFPALPQGPRSVVDCHFVTVGFTEALTALSHTEFYDLVVSAAVGHYATIGLEDWARGPSYIEIGGWIGDQTDAFAFMACAQAHGLGEVITPARLHITDQQQADSMAGLGYILLSGLKNPREEAVQEPT